MNKTIVSSIIYVTFREPGFHSWDGAPPHRAYLRDPHRHLFHIKVALHLNPGDSLNREIEFHDLLDRARIEFRGINEYPFTMPLSCEMMASRLANSLINYYPLWTIAVEVSEDGECGAIVTAHGKTPSRSPDGAPVAARPADLEFPVGG